MSASDGGNDGRHSNEDHEELRRAAPRDCGDRGTSLVSLVSCTWEDLVRRNLVLVTKRKSNGRIKSCGLHDLLRDLCLMRSLEDNFLLCFMGSFFLPEIFATQ
ncbi:hypothetical protein SASPL_150641 [Salvia splendens]|uniref:Uncharacterized protein n=1 Tax=Salvia splendens TaxID=180675 RepID=A0A8X8W6F9_SALSN|nr:hypothetical protein SASPL_150641 [Salvia splendens]